MCMKRNLSLTIAVCLLGAAAVGQPSSTLEGGPEEGVVGGTPDLRGIPGNGADFCFEAPVITGTGIFPFDSTSATTDGLGHGLCLVDGESQVARDLWWRWTSQCTGEVTVQTCGLTSVDTRIAVYAPGAPCVPTDNFLLDCGDIECGVQTRVTFSAVAGQTYLIRIGTYPLASGGVGEFEIRCDGEFDLCTDAVACQSPDPANARFSDNSSFRTADDITIVTPGDIVGLCFRGGYGFSVDPQGSVDNFMVTYYEDDGGIPGAPIARFRQGSDLALEGRRDTGELIAGFAPAWEYVVCHAPIPVQRNQMIWVEIMNDNITAGGMMWYWQFSQDGNLNSLYDGSVNDSYANAFVGSNDQAFCLRFRTCPTDINKNGTTDFGDLNALLVQFGFDCD